MLLAWQGYTTLYDVRHSLPQGWFMPLAFLALAWGGPLLLRAYNRLPPGYLSPNGLGLRYLALVVAITAAVGSLGPYAKLRFRLARGEFATYEGIVTNFQPGAPSMREEESWTLSMPGGSRYYHYGPLVMEGGFTRTAAVGGPVHAGMRVRVIDVDGRIARLEVANSTR